MSDFSELILAGHTEMCEQAGVNVTKGAVTKRGVSTTVAKGKNLEEAGYMGMAEGSVVLSKTDLAALGIVDRSDFTINSQTVRAIRIDSDDADPVAEVFFRHSR